jgi:hypothetical protein
MRADRYTIVSETDAWRVIDTNAADAVTLDSMIFGTSATNATDDDTNAADTTDTNAPQGVTIMPTYATTPNGTPTRAYPLADTINNHAPYTPITFRIGSTLYTTVNAFVQYDNYRTDARHMVLAVTADDPDTRGVHRSATNPLDTTVWLHVHADYVRYDDKNMSFSWRETPPAYEGSERETNAYNAIVGVLNQHMAQNSTPIAYDYAPIAPIETATTDYCGTGLSADTIGIFVIATNVWYVGAAGLPSIDDHNGNAYECTLHDYLAWIVSNGGTRAIVNGKRYTIAADMLTYPQDALPDTATTTNAPYGYTRVVHQIENVRTGARVHIGTAHADAVIEAFETEYARYGMHDLTITDNGYRAVIVLNHDTYGTRAGIYWLYFTQVLTLAPNADDDTNATDASTNRAVSIDQIVRAVMSQNPVNNSANDRAQIAHNSVPLDVVHVDTTHGAYDLALTIQWLTPTTLRLHDAYSETALRLDINMVAVRHALTFAQAVRRAVRIMLGHVLAETDDAHNGTSADDRRIDR